MYNVRSQLFIKPHNKFDYVFRQRYLSTLSRRLTKLCKKKKSYLYHLYLYYDVDYLHERDAHEKEIIWSIIVKPKCAALTWCRPATNAVHVTVPNHMVRSGTWRRARCRGPFQRPVAWRLGVRRTSRRPRNRPGWDRSATTWPRSSPWPGAGPWPRPRTGTGRRARPSWPPPWPTQGPRPTRAVPTGSGPAPRWVALPLPCTPATAATGVRHPPSCTICRRSRNCPRQSIPCSCTKHQTDIII